MYELINFVKDKIWIAEYKTKHNKMKFYTRMTIVKLNDNTIALFSPCEISRDLKIQINKIGKVKHIFFAGNFQYKNIKSVKSVYHEAKIYICHGINKKQKDLKFDKILNNSPILEEFEQIQIIDSKIMWEVAFFHKETKTLILVNLLENITDKTKGVSFLLKIWSKIFRMWNKTKPALEYQFGWKNKKSAGNCLNQILEWDFDKIIISYGDLITKNAKQIARKAWNTPLKYSTEKC